MASVRDIARLTNVSPATVSKVINGRPGVSVNTVRAVRHALESTGYQPVSKAINWNRITVVVPNFPSVLTKGTYISTTLAGVAEQALNIGMELSVKKLPQNVQTVADMKQMLLQDGSSGVILIALEDTYHFADLLGVERLPHVIIGETIHQHEVNQIILDNAQSAACVTEFLIEQGHKRLGVIYGHPSEIGQIQRLNACKQTVQQMLGDQGAVYAASCQCDDPFGELYHRSQPPTAIFCFDHPAAVTVFQQARREGIRIPEQLSLVSYVNDGTTAFLDPPLAELRVPTYEMGRQAVRMLKTQMSEGTQSNTTKRHQTTLLLQIRWTPGATTATPNLSQTVDLVSPEMI